MVSSEPSTRQPKNIKQKTPSAGSRFQTSRFKRMLPVLVVVAASVVVLIGLAALPLRTWLEQRSATSQTRDEVSSVEAEVAELELKLELLETDEEVERMARENFDLVFPGEESYRILPAPED